ncbi:MAG: RHS repeat-associated core domain-containing protein [Caldilineaceae bacterium]
MPPRLSYGLTNFGGTVPSGTIYLDTSQLSETQDEPVRGVAAVDGTALATGVYPYAMQVTSHYARSNVSANLTGYKIVLNERDSAFGSGWGLAGLQRLYPQEDSRVLLTDGDGYALLFTQANIFNVKVDGKANIFGAGRQVPPQPGGGGGGLLPVSIPFSSTTDAVFTFPLVTGEVSCNFSQPTTGPDGGNCYSTNGVDILSYQGIAGILHQNRNMFLVGVFLGPDTPQEPAPERLRFAAPSDFTELRPTLHQTFFIGDGYTSNDTLQRFYAPPGATRLFLGIADAYDFQTLPGYYDDNIGFFDVEVNLHGHSRQEQQYRSPEGDFSTITRADDGTYTRRLKDGTTYTFTAAGYQTAMTDRNGNRTTYAYDEAHRLIRITDPTGQTTTLSYGNGKLSAITDPQQRTTTVTHDGTGNLTQVTYPDGSTQRFGYDSRHLMTSEIDRRGEQTTRQYNQWGRLVSAQLPQAVERYVFAVSGSGLIDGSSGLGAESNPAPVTRPADAVGQIVDGEGRATRYTLGPVGYPATITDPAGFTTTIARDTNGNPLRAQLPSGAIFTQQYDERGNLLATFDQTVNGTTNYVYEPTFHQVTSSIDPLGNVTTFTYDAHGNLTSVTTPLQRTVQMTYNNQGLPTTLTDPLGRQTTFTYDANGNPTTLMTDAGAAERSTTLTYTPAGYPATLTDPLGSSYSYRYDDFGRVLQETLPGARTVTYGYDAEGNLITITPPGRPAHTFTYDGLGQITQYTPPTVNGVPNPATTYAYNKAQQPTQVTRPDGKALVYGYDNGGRLSMLTFSRGELAYRYSSTTGQPSSVTAPDGVDLAYIYSGELLTGVTWRGPISGSIRYAYDANYRITQETVNGSSISYSYDADDSLTQAGDLTFVYTATNGLLTGSTLGSVNDRWIYNPFGEPTGYAATQNGASLYAVRYDRDSLGRITSKTETIGGITTTYRYRYDAAQRLDQVERDGVVVEAYSYDANGNRLTGRSPRTGDVTGSYDEQDRLLQYGAATYSYTANGELLTKTENSQTTNYTYDELGNLTAVTLPDGTAIRYLIDGQNRRIGKQVNGVLVQGLLYLDQLNPVAELDGAGNLVTRFVYGNRVNVPEYMVKGGVTYRLLADHLGSVRLVMDTATGAVAQRLDYDAFGNVLQDTNPGFQPFGFAGGIYDAMTGLVRFGARDYDPIVGRWTSKDPIGFVSGSGNHYVYVGNSPVNFMDSNGLVFPLALLLPLVGGGIGAAFGGVGAYLSCQNVWTAAGKGFLLGTISSGTGLFLGARLAATTLPIGVKSFLAGAGGGFLGESLSQMYSGNFDATSLFLATVTGGYGGSTAGKLLPFRRGTFLPSLTKQRTLQNWGPNSSKLVNQTAISGLIGGSISMPITSAMSRVKSGCECPE